MYSSIFKKKVAIKILSQVINNNLENLIHQEMGDELGPFTINTFI